MDTDNRGWGISGFTLKMVAVISMLIDHIGATVLERILMTAGAAGFSIVNAHWQEFYILYMVLRGIGRLAFPIYCFLIVEGFVHTRSVAKYAARLFVFALLSEVPFDLAFNKGLWDMSYNNVFFTLFLGLLVIWGIRYVDRKIACENEDGSISHGKLLLRSILNMLLIFAGMALAELVLKCDYGAAGILAIVVLYLMRSHPKTAVLVTVVLLTVLCSELEIVALLDVLLIAGYNGTRGRKMKYFFYAFYPVHLLILSGICMLMGLGL
jgi:hypothetical protein